MFAGRRQLLSHTATEEQSPVSGPSGTLASRPAPRRPGLNTIGQDSCSASSQGYNRFGQDHRPICSAIVGFGHASGSRA